VGAGGAQEQGQLAAWVPCLFLPAAGAPWLPLEHLLGCCCWQPSELQQAEMPSPGQSAELKALPHSPIFVVPARDSQHFLTD